MPSGFSPVLELAMSRAAERKIVIGVIGGGQCTAQEAVLAETVGRELAKRGAVVICGGLGGVMEAVCRGAVIESGTTIGILPGDSPASANQYVQVPIATGLGEARNVVIVKSAQAVIAIGGDYGTLSEIAFALKNGTPVVGLNTWSFSRNEREDMSVVRAEDAVDAVEKAIALAKERKRC